MYQATLFISCCFKWLFSISDEEKENEFQDFEWISTTWKQISINVSFTHHHHHYHSDKQWRALSFILKKRLGSDLIVQKVAVKIFWVSATEQEFFLQKYVSKHVRASKLLEFRTFFSWCSKPSGKLYPWIFLLHSTLLKWSFWNKTEFKGMQMTQGTIYLSKFFSQIYTKSNQL